MESPTPAPVKTISQLGRRLISILIFAWICLPFGIMTAYQRAIAVWTHAMIESGRDPGMHEGFEFFIMYLYAPFAFISTLCLAILFFQRGPWARSRFTWQAIVAFILGGIPAIGVNVFFLSAWPS